MQPELTPRYRIILNELRETAGFHFEPDTVFFDRFLKKRTRSTASEVVESKIRECREMAVQLSQVKAVYGIFKPADQMAKWFPHATCTSLGLVTLGHQLDKRIDALNRENRHSDALLLDAWGSALVEGAVNSVDHVIRLEAQIMGLKAGKRRSPGYNPWNLSDQPFVLQVLKASRLNVILTDAMTMIPRKSVTFGIALV